MGKYITISVLVPFFVLIMLIHSVNASSSLAIDNRTGFKDNAVMTLSSIKNNTATGSQLLKNEERGNLVSNPDFSLPVNTSFSSSFLYNYPPDWNNSRQQCGDSFQCVVNFTDGWKDSTSFQISTTSNNNNTWSWIYGKEIDVDPSKKYSVVTHIKLNKFARGSHVVIEGSNETSDSWYQILQCPIGINGPSKWKTFNCELTIPKDTNIIRPVLNGGWSSQKNQQGITWFDAMYIKLKK
jgi:hypothetical protein